MTNSKVDGHFNNDSGTDFTKRVRFDQQRLIFEARFWRCHRMLHFIACRVLGGSERAGEAIGSCWRKASRHPQRFEQEGEFRSWLLRVVIDEALVLLRESVPAPTPKVLWEPIPARVFRGNDARVGKSLPSSRNKNVGTFFHESLGGGESDPAIASGNYGYLAFKCAHFDFLRISVPCYYGTLTTDVEQRASDSRFCALI